MLFTFRHVTYAYPAQNQRPALNDFNLDIPAGEKIAVVGRNGSGKSTFFLHLNGLFRPQSGQVTFRSQPLDYTRPGLKQLRQQVTLVFQNPDDQLFSASVFQDISFGPLNLGLSSEEARARVQEAAHLCSIEPLLHRPTHALSGGDLEQRKDLLVGGSRRVVDAKADPDRPVTDRAHRERTHHLDLLRRRGRVTIRGSDGLAEPGMTDRRRVVE